MNSLAATINAFVEDTCVIVVLAVLFARGRILALLAEQRRNRRDTLVLGLLFGAAGLTETVFPGARFPYVTHTMVVTFSGLSAGLPVASVAAVVVAMAACFLQPPASALLTVASMCCAAVTGSVARRLFGGKHVLAAGFAAGVLAQVMSLILRQSGPLQAGLPLKATQMAVSIPANGIGVLLLSLVVFEAQVRSESERHRAEAEHARSLAAEAQLSRIRARIHPHFLFNTLSSIAGLCGISPDKAERAIVRLGNLMRRALESETMQTVSLKTEIDYARDYLAIEQDRWGERLAVEWRIDTCVDTVQVPPFSLQTLLENAVGHGIAPTMGTGLVEVELRRNGSTVVVSVKDTGDGMDPSVLASARQPQPGPLHGLQILDQQLRMLHGSRARLRIFSRPYAGTLVVFSVPLAEHQREMAYAGTANGANRR